MFNRREMNDLTKRESLTFWLFKPSDEHYSLWLMMMIICTDFFNRSRSSPLQAQIQTVNVMKLGRIFEQKLLRKASRSFGSTFNEENKRDNFRAESLLPHNKTYHINETYIYVKRSKANPECLDASAIVSTNRLTTLYQYKKNSPQGQRPQPTSAATMF